MAESELLKLLEGEASLKGVFSRLEGEDVVVKARLIVREFQFGFKVTQRRDDYVFLTQKGLNLRGDEDRVYVHPYGSSIVYVIKEAEKKESR